MKFTKRSRCISRQSRILLRNVYDQKSDLYSLQIGPIWRVRACFSASYTATNLSFSSKDMSSGFSPKSTFLVYDCNSAKPLRSRFRCRSAFHLEKRDFQTGSCRFRNAGTLFVVSVLLFRQSLADSVQYFYFVARPRGSICIFGLQISFRHLSFNGVSIPASRIYMTP